jgi:hypothetical protein
VQEEPLEPALRALLAGSVRGLIAYCGSSRSGSQPTECQIRLTQADPSKVGTQDGCKLPPREPSPPERDGTTHFVFDSLVSPVRILDAIQGPHWPMPTPPPRRLGLSVLPVQDWQDGEPLGPPVQMGCA